MMANAIAAHVIWIGQPSGTVSSTMQVMNRRPNEAPPQTDECMLASHSGGVGSLIWRTTDKSRLDLTKYV
jgi:hypothetical protein